MAIPERTASCSCGQLRAVVTGEPVRVSMCHCVACQRRTGSTYGYQARFPSSQCEISGRVTEFVRHSDVDHDERRYRFCPGCGATVYYTTGSDPDLVAIPVGAFADPGFPPPRFSVWEARRHSWVSVPEDAERIG